MAVQRRWDGEERREAQAEAPLGSLIRDLGQDGAALVRQEINLAKLEFKEAIGQITSGAMGAAIWAGLALVGGLALTACLILLIGMALDGAYWAGALIVGAVFVLVGGLLAWRSVKKIRETDVKPDQTISTLKEDRRWIGREAREFRRELTA
ncbi:MAG TPA: phage holin family protein [Longimicrobiales bacterium]